MPAKKKVKVAAAKKASRLAAMPVIVVDQADLARFGARWQARKGSLSRTPPESSSQLGILFDTAVATALAQMLGKVDVVAPVRESLVPPQANSVELGGALVVGGVRPQNFDVTYRPDGVRFAFDSKTLNDTKSVNKNYQNMINDLATEATTVHVRFPYALVAFMVVIPRPCLKALQEAALLGTLERLGRREEVDDPAQEAEAIALVIWNPEDGTLDLEVPSAESPVRLSAFSERIQRIYEKRYKGLPPHVAVGKEAQEAEKEKPGES